MNAAVFAFALLAIVSLWISVSITMDCEPVVGRLFFIVFCGFVWAASKSWDTPEQAAAHKAEVERRHLEEITPRKVSSADGCTVYAFKPQDRWLYFTKCEKAETTTVNQWTVNTGSGKTHSSHEETMEIKTK